MKKKFDRMPDSDRKGAMFKSEPDVDIHEEFPGGYQDNMYLQTNYYFVQNFKIFILL